MPRALSQGRVRVRVLEERPADINAVTAEEANAGHELACSILASDFRMGAVASDTLSENPLCAKGNTTDFGNSNVEANLTIFRYFQANGLVDLAGDAAFQLMKEKGTHLNILVSEGVDNESDFEDGQEYSYFEFITDNPQPPQTREGYVKRAIPLGWQGVAAFDKYIGGEEPAQPAP